MTESIRTFLDCPLTVGLVLDLPVLGWCVLCASQCRSRNFSCIRFRLWRGLYPISQPIASPAHRMSWLSRVIAAYCILLFLKGCLCPIGHLLDKV